MAQTKKKRQTKHRGNAAGVVESRGRTGRKLTDAEREAGRKGAAPGGRRNRFDYPPTWRSAVNRSLIAVVFFVVVLTFLLKQNLTSAMVMGVVLLGLYIPVSYYTDLWMYRRRQAKLHGAGKP